MGAVLWLVGRTIDAELSAWEFMGIYESKLEAVRRCSRQSDFVAQVEVGSDAPEKREYFPGAVYPVRKL